MAETAKTPHREPTLPNSTTVKRLFAHSGNRCAFPKCTVNIVHGSIVVGEVCHIKAKSPSGPRYDAQQSPSERRGYDNLIILCPTHHTVIDDDPEAYTADRLTKMKKGHEGDAASIPSELIEQGTRLLIDQSVTAINQSGGITAHTVNINVDGSRQTWEPRLASSPPEKSRHQYAEDMKRIVRQLIHNQMTPEGKLALRHLLIHEPIEVGRTFLTDIPQERLHAQLGIAKQSGVVQHDVVKQGMRRTYWIINPRFRPILEELLYEDGKA